MDAHPRAEVRISARRWRIVGGDRAVCRPRGAVPALPVVTDGEEGMPRWIAGFIITSSMALIASLCASPALAQEATREPAAAQPVASAQEPQSNGEGVLKTSADWIQNKFGSGVAKDGFYPEFSGVPPGSGIVAGPGYRHRLFGGHALVSASAAISVSRSRFGQATFELPQLAGDHLSVGAQIKQQNFTRVSYFGVGPASAKADHTDYGLNNTDSIAFAALKPNRQVTIGGHFGFSRHVDIVTPKSASFPATQDFFTEGTAPGLVEHPAFLHTDAYLDVDTRDHHSRPTTGGDYRVTFMNFNDRDFSRYSFRRLEAEASQFIPVPHEKGVIALRARVAGSGTASNDVVPFYLLPTLGGSRSLRGYEDYRFRDRNLLLLNAEYRWTVLGALDGAVFYDAGKVEPRFGDLGLNNLRKSYGIGFRYHSDETTFVRLDIGRSREGTRLLLSVGEVLRPGHGSISIPYVP
jgi:hypothetical protein